MRSVDFHSRLSAAQRVIAGAEVLILVTAMVAAFVNAGFTKASQQHDQELALMVLTAMSLLTGLRLLQFGIQWYLHRMPAPVPPPDAKAERLCIPVIWGVLSLLCLVVPDPWVRAADVATRLQLWVRVTEGFLIIAALLSALRLGRRLATITQNSSLLLAGSFIVLIAVGTLLLRLPLCRAVTDPAVGAQSAPWNVALFTATSAACVTGLIVEPTGSYWTTTGHVVILCLIQFGGLGILTFGAFMAVLSRRQNWQFREAATLSELLDSESTLSARQLLRMIVFFTITTEFLGALCLLGLWDDEPAVWYSLFHSVSAFCNAGFSLRDEGLAGLAGRWQVAFVVTTLIILGGLGFSVIQDLWQNLVHRRTKGPATTILGRKTIHRRLSVHTRIVLVTAGWLLLIGGLGYMIFESLNVTRADSPGTLLQNAWFQTVTFRTAGFNTVDHATMHPATKLLAMFLMFIGAAPGSTGGGVKTVIFALMVLNLIAVMRGRDHVEVFGRSIPVHQVSRSLAIIGAGLTVVLTTAGLLMVFEQSPHRSLDYLFEATSAFATVGVSAGVTGDLSLPSRLVIIVVMFLGRIGPITLLLAMSGPRQAGAYTLPEERVSLG